MIENSNVTLPLNGGRKFIDFAQRVRSFVANTFKDLYYTDAENDLIDPLRTNIAEIHDQYKRAICNIALIRACTKKRPREISSHIRSQRYNDGRKDLQKHFLSTKIS